MLHFEFVAEKHEDFGTMGWRQKDQPGFDPLGGMAVAHDILEHFPGGTDSVADEFQALGASLWLRGETGFDERGGDAPADNLAAEFDSIYRHVEHEGYSFPEPPKQRALQSYTEDVLSKVASKALKSWIKDGEGQTQPQVRDFVRKAIGWMRVGYRRAVRRYRRYDQNQLSWLFRKIMQEADTLLKGVEFEGYELHVDVNLTRYTARLRVMHENEDGRMEEV